MTSSERRRVLIFCDYYLPGFKAGGPIASIRNAVERLSDRFDFSIVTRDRDLGDGEPYPEIAAGQWNPVGDASVAYLAPADARVSRFSAILSEVRPDVVYCNSLLSRRFSLFPLLATRRSRMAPRIVLAPRGELAPAALALKARRKALYIQVLRVSGIWRGLHWQASSEHEAADIRRVFGRQIDVHVAPDLPPIPPPLFNRPEKRAGEARIVFLGRISPMKNLTGALAALKPVSGNVTFEIYGPAEDQAYLAECRPLIESLPPNIKSNLRGALPPADVHRTLTQADALFLPSLGENFAQVVAEALAAACPVVVSDRTPWRNLERLGIGYDRPLEAPGALTGALQDIVNMDDGTHGRMRKAARAHAESLAGDQAVVEATAVLLSGS